MEETKKTTIKEIIFNYGGLLGLVSIIIASINYAVGNPYQPHWTVSVSSILITTAVIILGIKKFKAGQEGYLTLSEALKTGMGIALISALIYVIFQFILTGYVDPDYYDKALELQRATMIERNPDLTDEQIESAISMAKKFTSPYITAAISIIASLFIGFIISIIGGSIMKKNRELN